MCGVDLWYSERLSKVEICNVAGFTCGYCPPPDMEEAVEWLQEYLRDEAKDREAEGKSA